jgi:hypothetical protein
LRAKAAEASVHERDGSFVRAHNAVPFRRMARSTVTGAIRVATLCGASFGCAGQRATTVSASPATPPASAPVDSSAALSGSALNAYRPGRVTYDLTLRSVVQVVAGDSVPRSDSAHATAVVTATFTTAPGATGSSSSVARVDTRSDSVTLVVNGSSAPQAQRSTESSYLLDIDLATGMVRRRQLPGGTCVFGEPESILAGDEAVPNIPVGPIPTRSWLDTTRYELCRGGIPLRVTRVARYRPEPVAPGDSLLRIIRVSDATLEGQGSQWQQPVRAAGTGVSIDTIVVGTRTGRTHSIVANSRVEMDFTSTFRTQRFRQEASSRLQAREQQ